MLEAAFAAIIREAHARPEFGARLLAALGGPVTGQKAGGAAARSAGRRAPAALDPFAVYAEGEDSLRARLSALTVDQLKDIVAAHGMDPSRLALKWKRADRLIDLIVTMVRDRRDKGEVFRPQT